MSKEEKMKYLATIGLLTALTAGASAYAVDCPTLTNDQLQAFSTTGMMNPVNISGTNWWTMTTIPNNKMIAVPPHSVSAGVKLPGTDVAGQVICLYNVEDANGVKFSLQIQQQAATQ
jgi:hypothetical protein